MKVKTKDGKIFDLQVQQYIMGVYYCLYKKGLLYKRVEINVTKEAFLKDLRNGKLKLTLINE